MFIERNISKIVQDFASFFPVLAIMGPRQSGKTTLVRHLFANYHYLNLENLDLLELSKADPRGFLEGLLKYAGVIIDEFQNHPDLLSYLQILVDREQRPGFFVLTGSHNFLMNQAIGQSLAGRVGILTLLPLAQSEINRANLTVPSAEMAIYRGFYPRIVESRSLPPSQIYPSYIQTYLERDLRTISHIADLLLFKKFLGLCAGRVGQILNISSLATDCGVSAKTVKSWLSILEASYIVFLLQPHHANFNKRLIKNPKLYFYDTGIACSLLGIDSTEQLSNHYLRGALFENLVVGDLTKQFYNVAKNPPLYFWRDNHGHEIDCLIETAGKFLPIEIKASMTMSKNFLKELQFWKELANVEKGMLIYAGEEIQNIQHNQILNWQRIDILKAV